MPLLIPQVGGADTRVSPGVNFAVLDSGNANPFHAASALATTAININFALTGNPLTPLPETFGFGWLTYSFKEAPPAGVHLLISLFQALGVRTVDKLFLAPVAGPGQLTIGVEFPVNSTNCQVAIMDGGTVDKTLTLHGLRRGR
jgi:hypothetical protein